MNIWLLLAAKLASIQVFYDLFSYFLLLVEHLVIFTIINNAVMSSLNYAHGVSFYPHLSPINTSFASAIEMFWYSSQIVFFIYLKPVLHMTWTVFLILQGQTYLWRAFTNPFGRVSHFSSNPIKYFVHWTLFIVFIGIFYLVMNLYFYRTKLWVSQHLSFSFVK